MRFLMRLIAPAMLTVSLLACGGGGSSDSDSVMTQANYEAAAVGEGYYNIAWNLPPVGSALVDGTNYIYAGHSSVSQSPRTGEQVGQKELINLTAGLQVPDLLTTHQNRYLKDGAIYRRGSIDWAVISFAGQDVEIDYYDRAGSTLLYTIVFDEWNEPVNLSGPISSSNVPKSYLSFLRRNDPSNFDFTTQWLPGSAYILRKAYVGTDTVRVMDWSGSTNDTDVNPVSDSISTIEGWFSSSGVVSNGGVGVDGVRYNLTDGSIRMLEGVRAWVANNPRPLSASPTESRVVFFELNSKLYFGWLTRSGARERTVDALDTTRLLDHSIRFNKAAVDSIAAAIKF